MRRSYIDIGANMLDEMYQGVYHGHANHAPDVDAVLERAHARGVTHLIVTAGTVEETAAGVAFCAARAGRPGTPALYSTAGVHPTRCSSLGATDVAALAATVAAHGRHVGGRVVALGEMGIDHDRLQFCPAAAQAAGFEAQLRGLAGPGAAALPLPLFLHYRGAPASAGTAFFDVLQRTRGLWGARGGVVHSFTGTADDVARVLALGLAVSVNGVSFRTREGIAASTLVPADRLLLETDAPWCDIRPTHPSHALLQAARARLLAQADDADAPDLAPIPTCRRDRFREGCAVKGRNEPATIPDVLLVAAEARHEDPTVLAQQAYNNTISMFFS